MSLQNNGLEIVYVRKNFTSMLNFHDSLKLVMQFIFDTTPIIFVNSVLKAQDAIQDKLCNLVNSINSVHFAHSLNCFHQGLTCFVIVNRNSQFIRNITSTSLTSESLNTKLFLRRILFCAYNRRISHDQG